MKNFLVLAVGALALTLAAAPPAVAFDLGVANLNSGSASGSQAATSSVGGSFSALQGITAQGSQASASNGGAAGTVVSGNNTFAFSGTSGQSAQSGFSGSLGLATSVNGNQAASNGVATAANLLSAQYLFVQP